MPSGSTRLIVASLYSFPLTVLKSSENAAAVKDRIKNAPTNAVALSEAKHLWAVFVFTSYLAQSHFCSHIRSSSVKENHWVGVRCIGPLSLSLSLSLSL